MEDMEGLIVNISDLTKKIEHCIALCEVEGDQGHNKDVEFTAGSTKRMLEQAERSMIGFEKNLGVLKQFNTQQQSVDA